MRPTPFIEGTPELPPTGPPSRTERRQAALYIAVTGTAVALVVLAVAFDQLAATGVLVVVFLSFFLAYLIAPAVERFRYFAAPSKRGRPLPRGHAVLGIYGLIAVLALPVWVFNGQRFSAALGRTTVLVPQHTSRFISQLHASEHWHERLGLPVVVNITVGSITRYATSSIEDEAHRLSAELVGIRRLVPWLSLVPVIVFLLLTRWHRFRRSTTRVLPTPHLQWRGNEFLRNLNSVLAAYTRAQTFSAFIVGMVCWTAFAVMGLPYPGTLGIAAGLLEMVPLAGPLVMAVVATAMAGDRVVAVLVFLGSLRILQDYVIYPRLIRHALKLHPVAVVMALWVGGALGGIAGVCLAVPVVGMTQVTHRHWREYREIERLVAETAAHRAG